MTPEQADKQSANPKYVSPFDRKKYIDMRDRPYCVNCQTCAPAYALRLMGFDVSAKGNTPGSLSEYLSYQNSFEAWLNADGSAAAPTLYCDWMKTKGYKSMTTKRYREFFEECCRQEGIYIITIGWKGGGGHATVLQRFNNGTLAYIEPQEFDENQGVRRTIDYLCNQGTTSPHYKRGILRVDNKVFNLKFASIFDKQTN